MVVGHPEKSLLYQAVRYEDENLQMPPKSKLLPEEIQIVKQWIEWGAPDPRSDDSNRGSRNVTIDFEQARSNWPYYPLKAVALPPVSTTAWPRSPIDRFILQQLESQQLEPAPDAAPQTLLRRMSYDLTGLPPTDEMREQFTAATDHQPELSFEVLSRFVDQLLASPAFGEKWGRHWLDIARYADSNGATAITRFIRHGGIATMSSMPSIAIVRTISLYANRSPVI